MRASIMLAAASCALLAALLPAGAAALDCGAAGEITYLSGCLNCSSITFNHTEWHKNKTKEGKDGKAVKPWWPKPSGPITLPTCTECDTANNFVLVTKDHFGKKNSSKPVIARCGCADGYGVVVTGNATVAWGGNKTKTIPLFSCVPCKADEVVLSKESGLKPVLDPATGQWSLVLRPSKPGKLPGKQGTKGSEEALADSDAAAAAAVPQGKPLGGKPGKLGGKQGGNKGDKKPWGNGGDWKKWKASPFVPGSCVPCPVGSKKEGPACVPL